MHHNSVFSHNKSASAGLSAAEIISRTAGKETTTIEKTVIESEQLPDQNHHSFWDQLEHKHDLEKETTTIVKTMTWITDSVVSYGYKPNLAIVLHMFFLKPFIFKNKIGASSHSCQMGLSIRTRQHHGFAATVEKISTRQIRNFYYSCGMHANVQ